LINDSFQPPESEKLDVLHKGARAALSMVPFAGAPLAELFQFFLASPLEQRRQIWMERVGGVLERLAANGLDTEDLQNSPAFVTAISHASQIAIREHREEKLTALANAIENIGLGVNIDDDERSILFTLIEIFTPLHLRVLSFAQSPPNFGLSLGALSTSLCRAIPELGNRRELYDLIWKDLYTNGLVEGGNLHVMISGGGLVQKQTTRFGDRLLDLICRAVDAPK